MVGCHTGLFGNEYCENCQFPFTYGGETFYNCTRTGYHLSWCSTKTFSNNVHMTGFWGACTYDPNAVRIVTPTNFTYVTDGNFTSGGFTNNTFSENFPESIGNYTSYDFLGNSSRYD